MILRRSTSLIPSSSSSSLRLFLPRPVSLIPPLPTQTSPSHTLPSRSLLPRNASIFFFSTSTAMAAPYETVFAKDAAPRKNLCLFLFFYFSQVHQALTIDFPYNSCRPIRTSIHPSTPPPPPLELTWEKKKYRATQSKPTVSSSPPAKSLVPPTARSSPRVPSARKPRSSFKTLKPSWKLRGQVWIRWSKSRYVYIYIYPFLP